MRMTMERGHGKLTFILCGLVLFLSGRPTFAGYDHNKYMSPDELRPGMRGYGRTVMSGSKIETFQVEIVGVMKNAYYAKQDVILVRCSGLNLEHSGIIGGMSGSPCYIKDDSGKERMIGAIAYGWTFNKDPVAGVQPITQMLPIPDVRTPKAPTPGEKSPPNAAAGEKNSTGGGGQDLGKLVAQMATEPLSRSCRFSIFNDEIVKSIAQNAPKELSNDSLRPLRMPVMVSGVSRRGMERLSRCFERYGMEPVASGAASAAVMADADRIKLEPGSALCIPFMTGDMMMEGLGTCTEVDGSRVLGFGHAMFGAGSVELPLSTGVVHTVISSVMRSNKMGAAVKNVGSLVGDENSGIFGLTGSAPDMIPIEVVIKDVRGERTYHYKAVQERSFTPQMLGTAVMESMFAHNDPPKEHTIHYSVESEFKDVGTFRTSNFSSQDGGFGLTEETFLPAMALMNAPFGRAKLARAKVEVTIEEGASLAKLDEASLDKVAYKPGETVTANVRWRHYLSNPQFTRETYSLKLPEDLPDGEYDLTVGSNDTHLIALKQEKPHLFDVKSLSEMLRTFNLMASFASNKVYLHLVLPVSGLAIRDVEMPRLPSYARQTLLASKRSDVRKFTESQLTSYETKFAVEGAQTLKVKVSRRADQ